MSLLGDVYFRQMKFVEAERLLKEAIDGQRAVLGENAEQTLFTSASLAQFYWHRGDDAKAEELLHDILEIERKLHREHGRLSMVTRGSLGLLYSRQRLPDKAEPLLLEALEDARRSDGRQSVVKLLGYLAYMYSAAGNPAEGERRALEALACARKEFGEHNVDTLEALLYLGNLYFSQRQFEKAEPTLLHYLEDVQNGYGDYDVDVIVPLDELGKLYRWTEQYDKGIRSLEQAWEVARQRHGANDSRVRVAFDNLADLLKERALWNRRQGRSNEADADIAKFTQLCESDVPAAVRARAGLYKRLGRFADALADQTRAVQLDPSDRNSLEDVAALNLYLGHENEYRAARSVLLSRFGQTPGDHPAKTCLLGPPQEEEAKEAMAMVDRALSSGADAFTLQYLHSAKGMAEYRCGNYVQALKWLTLSREALTRTIATRDGRDRFIWDEVLTTDDLFIAMSQYQLGDCQAARDMLARAQKQLQTQVPSESSGSLKLEMSDWLMVQIIAREAQRAILVNDPTTRPSTTLPASATTK